jgi:hypothetical protein
MERTDLGDDVEKMGKAVDPVHLSLEARPAMLPKNLHHLEVIRSAVRRNTYYLRRNKGLFSDQKQDADVEVGSHPILDPKLVQDPGQDLS